MSASPKAIPQRFASRFVRGNITVRIDGMTAEYPKTLISASGVYGLRWPPLVPAKHYGKVAKVKVDMSIDGKPFTFEVPASITRELTMRSERMGLKFLYPNEAANEKVLDFILQHGHTPTEYNRKYPRIPSKLFMDSFNLKASALAEATGLNHDPKRIAYRIGNLSPDGLLLQTNSENARHIRPGDILDLAITQDSRTAPDIDIRAKVKVFRFSQEVQSPSNEEVWQLGSQFSKIDEKNKAAYFRLLEHVLRKIQTT